jgi:DedD protein
MPDTLTPESLELKRRGRRRLIGAIAIALLLVVFLPMFFDSEPRRGGADEKEVVLTLPAKEGLPPLPAPVPVAAAASVPALPSRAETAVAATATTVTPPARVDAAPAAAKPDVKSAPPATVGKADGKAGQPAPREIKPATRSEIPSPAKAAAELKKEGFAVQLGAFSDPDHIKQLKTRMLEAKIPVYTEEIKVASGAALRVRAGPFKTRPVAEKALQKIKAAGIADGKVVPLKPETP